MASRSIDQETKKRKERTMSYLSAPSNLPDDWNHYYRNCSLCGNRYHASEGGCNCTSDCNWCGEEKDRSEFGEDGDGICDECWECGVCGEDTPLNNRYFVLRPQDDFDGNDPPKDMYTYCLKCKEKDEKENNYRFMRVEE